MSKTKKNQCSIDISNIGFDACADFPNFPKKNSLRGRVYFHKAGREQAFGKINPLTRGFIHLRGVLMEQDFNPYKCFQYCLAAIWGDHDDRNFVPCIDFFGYSGIAKHRSSAGPVNPEVYTWTTKDGVLVPAQKTGIIPAGCGDFELVRAIEESYRREKKSLEEFLDKPPHIPGVEYLPNLDGLIKSNAHVL